MLVALYENDLVDMLDTQTKQQWSLMMKTGKLVCPVCKSRVTPKCGTKKTWHFAHTANSTCDIETEAETEYHLLGKKSLYRWLQTLHEKATLEFYIKVIKQRPDLYLHEKKHVLEFQCATMASELLEKRIKGYQSISLQSEWIFGMKRMKKLNHFQFQIQGADFKAVKKDKGGHLFLNYFCPLQQRFLSLRHIVPLTATKIGAIASSYTTKTLRNPSILSSDLIPEKLPITLWNKQKANWRMTAYKNRLPSCIYVKKILYNNHKSLTLFSSLSGIPTKDFFMMETPPFIWQSYLLFYIDKKVSVSLDEILIKFGWLIQKRIFQARNLPYLKETWEDAVKEYISFLESENIIRKTGEGYYKKCSVIPYPKTMDDAQEQDEIFSKKAVFFDLA
jgi:competence protein CoiA